MAGVVKAKRGSWRRHPSCTLLLRLLRPSCSGRLRHKISGDARSRSKPYQAARVGGRDPTVPPARPTARVGYVRPPNPSRAVAEGSTPDDRAPTPAHAVPPARPPYEFEPRESPPDRAQTWRNSPRVQRRKERATSRQPTRHEFRFVRVSLRDPMRNVRRRVDRVRGKLPP